MFLDRGDVCQTGVNLCGTFGGVEHHQYAQPHHPLLNYKSLKVNVQCELKQMNQWL